MQFSPYTHNFSSALFPILNCNLFRWVKKNSLCRKKPSEIPAVQPSINCSSHVYTYTSSVSSWQEFLHIFTYTFSTKFFLNTHDRAMCAIISFLKIHTQLHEIHTFFFIFEEFVTLSQCLLVLFWYETQLIKVYYDRTIKEHFMPCIFSIGIC